MLFDRTFTTQIGRKARKLSRKYKLYKLNEASPCGDMMHLLCKYDVAPLLATMMRCLPLCAAGTHRRQSRHHWRIQHHLP